MSTSDPAGPDHRWTAVRAGNTYDKYGTSNPVARRLVAGFLRDVDTMIDTAHPSDLVDVGCGEGVVTARMAARAGVSRALGLDRESERLRAHWAQHRSASLGFDVADAHTLPFDDGTWDLACSIEVLEQVHDPRAALDELARVARRHVLVSVPREPIWRMLNVARGAYLRAWGTPPGSTHFFSSRAFVELCRTAGEPVAVATPFPWTMVLLRVG